MSLMDWDAGKFDVLVPKMNEQHHRLVNIMNQLYDRHAEGAAKPALDKLLVQLRDFTIKHFREEEAMLEQMQFPSLSRHKLIHESLLQEFGKHYDAFSKGNGEISSAFFDYLRLWLTSHIMHIDRKYGEFSKQQSVA